MTQKTFRLAYLLPGAAAAALLGGMPTVAQATPCALGTIVEFEIPSGERSEIRVVGDATPSGVGEQKQLAGGGLGTQFWLDNDTRYEDRMQALRTAFALGQPVEMHSNDDNCMGSSGEFYIHLNQSADGLLRAKRDAEVSDTDDAASQAQSATNAALQAINASGLLNPNDESLRKAMSATDAAEALRNALNLRATSKAP